MKCRRIILSMLLAVAVLATLRVPAFADNLQVRMSAPACHCHEGCAPNTGVCKEQSSCAATCGGGVLVADIGFAVFAAESLARALHEDAEALRALTHPPPLGPPRT